MESYQKEGQQTEQNTQSEELTFSLKKLNASDRATQVSVSFSIISRSLGESHQAGGQAQMVNTRSLPVFNSDQNYFTPCFVLESDSIKVQKNLNFYLDYHLVKVEEASEEKEEILVAKPSRNHSFCGLCRVHYQDYIDHTMLEIHRDNLKKAKLEKNVSILQKILTKRDKRVERMLKKVQREALKTKKVKKERKPRAAKPLEQNIEQGNSVSTLMVA